MNDSTIQKILIQLREHETALTEIPTIFVQLSKAIDDQLRTIRASIRALVDVDNGEASDALASAIAIIGRKVDDLDRRIGNVEDDMHRLNR